jgi:hypothetical protein
VASQLFGVTYRLNVKTSEKQSATVQEFLQRLKDAGADASTPAALPAIPTENVLLISWMFNTSKKQLGSTDQAALKKTLESMEGVSNYPENLTLQFGNPRYSPTVHTTKNLDYSNFWGIATVSKLENFQWTGRSLPVKY